MITAAKLRKEEGGGVAHHNINRGNPPNPSELGIWHQESISCKRLRFLAGLLAQLGMGLAHRHGHHAGGLKIEETVACKVLTLLAVMTALLQFLLVVQWGEGMASVERARIHQMEGILAQERGSASPAAGDAMELDSTMVIGDEAGEARPEDAGRGRRGRGGAYNSHHDGEGILGDLADEWFGGGSDKAGFEASVAARSYDAMMHDDSCRQGGAEEENRADGPHPLRGPEFGGTRVVFPLQTESNIDVGTGAACRFGELSVVGTVIASGRGKAVECRSPAQTYVFRAGDSLRAVASSLGVSVNHLSSVNSEIKDLNKVQIVDTPLHPCTIPPLVCMYVRMYVCMYICVYICIYIYMSVCIYI